MEEPSTAMRQLPLRISLVKEYGTKSNQHFMHESIAVFTGSRQEQIPVAN